MRKHGGVFVMVARGLFTISAVLLWSTSVSAIEHPCGCKLPRALSADQVEMLFLKFFDCNSLNEAPFYFGSVIGGIAFDEKVPISDVKSSINIAILSQIIAWNSNLSAKSTLMYSPFFLDSIRQNPVDRKTGLFKDAQRGVGLTTSFGFFVYSNTNEIDVIENDFFGPQFVTDTYKISESCKISQSKNNNIILATAVYGSRALPSQRCVLLGNLMHYGFSGYHRLNASPLLDIPDAVAVNEIKQMWTSAFSNSSGLLSLPPNVGFCEGAAWLASQDGVTPTNPQ